MEQFDREDSSTYVEPEQSRSFQPAEEKPVQPPAQQPPKPKKSKTPLVLMLLLVLALVGAGTLGWMWYQQNGRVDNLESDLSSVRNQNQQLKSAAAAEAKLDKESTDGVSTDTTSSDSDAIIKAALAYALADATAEADTKATIAKSTNEFARVTVGSTFGYYQILKKTNDIWVVIAAGNGELSSETIDRYKIPAEIIKS